MVHMSSTIFSFLRIIPSGTCANTEFNFYIHEYILTTNDLQDIFENLDGICQETHWPGVYIHPNV